MELLMMTEVKNFEDKSYRDYEYVKIADGVEEIPAKTFSNCKNLKAIYIPSSVVSIGSWAFSSCYNLIEVVSYAEKIGRSTFEGCWNINKIELHDCMNVGDRAFFKCISLTNASINSEEISFGAASFSNAGRDGGMNFEIKSSEIILHDAVFRNSRINKFNTTANVRAFGERIFENCYSLQEIRCNWLTDIKYHTFTNCRKMDLCKLTHKKDDNPRKAWGRYMSKDAFDGCDSLTHLYLPFPVK